MNSIRCSQCEHYIEANAGEGKIYGCDRSRCVFEPTTMSREEALKWLKEFKYMFWDGMPEEALDVAIEALEEPTTKNDSGVDCISRADARSLICNIDIKHGMHGMTRKVFKDLYNGMDDLPSVTPQEPRWISVSERLPEIHNYCDKYLVTLERGWVRTASFTECDGNHWWSYDDVVAWMPLPQPYSEVEE